MPNFGIVGQIYFGGDRDDGNDGGEDGDCRDAKFCVSTKGNTKQPPILIGPRGFMRTFPTCHCNGDVFLYIVECDIET
ncbi:MAG: hypothetical protein WCS73_12065 [Lentisphaeria bacterium]